MRKNKKLPDMPLFAHDYAMLTPEDYISVLTDVKNELLRDGGFICIILEFMDDRYGRLTPRYQACRKLLKFIDVVLGGEDVSLEAWLSQRGFSAFDVSEQDRTNYRIRWVDSLISEYRKDATLVANRA